jgi:hypothetical protein
MIQKINRRDTSNNKKMPNKLFKFSLNKRATRDIRTVSFSFISLKKEVNETLFHFYYRTFDDI